MNELIANWAPDSLATAPWVTALGWALIHFLWQGAVIGALFAGGNWILRNARPQARYTLGLMCMVALLVAPLATLLTLYQHASSAPVIIAWPDGAIATHAAAVAGDWQLSNWLEQGLPWLVALWAIGVVLMTGRVGLNWYRMVRLTRVGVLPLPAQLLEQVAVLKALFGIRRGVQVLETTLMQVPTVLGWLRPVILLPTSSLVGLTPAQLELVIAHELGHIRRYDYLMNLFQVFVETLLYYHPVVGWISRQVRHEREQCCDDLVVVRCGNRIEYAKALTNLESIRSGYHAPALAATEGKLVERIERIVCAHSRRNEAVFGNSGLLLLVAAVILLAGQLTDPMAAFEDRRSRLGDALVAELLADQQQRDFVPLDQASVRVVAEEKARPQAVFQPQTRVTTPAPATPLTAAAKTLATKPAQQQTLASAQPTIIASAGITRPQFDARIATRPDPAVTPQKTETLSPAPPVPAPLVAVVNAQTGPVAIQRVSPEYPVRARIAGQQGYVTLEFTVRNDGRVSDIHVTDSRPRRVFDRAAMRALKGWRFDPGTVTSADRVSQRFDFNLQSGAALDPADRSCLPLTGTRICRPDSPTSLLAAEANLP